MIASFQITNHAKQRYTQRIFDFGKNESYLVSMLKSLSKGKDITSKIYDEVPRYILYLYEKHGELGQTIIESDNTIFVTKKRKGTEKMYDVITCYSNYRYIEQYKNTKLSREEIYLKIKTIKMKIKQAKA